MRTALLAVIFCFAAAIATASAQDCPKGNPNGPSIESASRTLKGRVVYHNDLRQWFGLHLDQPVCGEKEIQLLQGGGAFEVDESNAHAIEAFRGCIVTVQGSLGIPGTGYYSAELYQNVDKIEPAPGCIRQPLFPDYSKAKPRALVRSYSVSMRIDYRPQGGPIAVTVSSGDHLLNPWQAYASYFLTGGFALYASCADDFDLVKFTGTPEMKPWRLDNQILMDPETASQKHVTQLRLDYTCRRSK